MGKNTDWEAWDEEFGPRNMEEALALKVATGTAGTFGPYTSEPSSNNEAWYIKREGQRTLCLVGPNARKGFQQFLWHYTSGKRKWRKGPATLEKFFTD